MRGGLESHVNNVKNNIFKLFYLRQTISERKIPTDTYRGIFWICSTFYSKQTISERKIPIDIYREQYFEFAQLFNQDKL